MQTRLIAFKTKASSYNTPMKPQPSFTQQNREREAGTIGRRSKLIFISISEKDDRVYFCFFDKLYN